MPGFITGTVVAATAVTMVAFDAAEYAAFSVIEKQLKLKGAKHMTFTVSDFIAQAKAKKAQAEAVTTNVVDKAKEVVATAKDAVIGVLPASNKEVAELAAKVNRIAETMAVFQAQNEQRIDFIEDTIGSGIQVDPEELTVRVAEILSVLNPPKKEAKVKQEPQAKVTKAEVAAKKVDAPKPRRQSAFTMRSENPADWSSIPNHD